MGLIERLNLYDIVFTDPADVGLVADTKFWTRAYKFVWEMSHDITVEASQDMATLKDVLFRDSQDKFLAWILVCFTPWARETAPPPLKKASKPPPTLAGIVVREGLKLDNKICKLVDDAVRRLPKVSSMRKAFVPHDRNDQTVQGDLKADLGREVHGQFLRSMGTSWRSVVTFAIMLEVSEAQNETGEGFAQSHICSEPAANKSSERRTLLHQYAAWMRILQSLDLLEVDKLAPLIKGDQLCKALDLKPGPWMQKALTLALEWQLRNPAATDTTVGIVEVVERKEEFL